MYEVRVLLACAPREDGEAMTNYQQACPPGRPRLGFDSAEYKAIHEWINRRYPRTGRCEYCGRTDRRTQYASVEHQYTRDRADWFEFCKPCHAAFDGSGAKALQSHREAGRFGNVCFNRGKKRWQAVVTLGGKVHWLGYHRTEAAAREALAQAQREFASGRPVVTPQPAPRGAIHRRKRDGKWQATLMVRGQRYWFGAHATEAAARAALADGLRAIDRRDAA